MGAWDRPQTAEELAAKPRRRPFDELIREYSARTGSPLMRATHVPPSSQAKRVLTEAHVRIVRKLYAGGATCEEIARTFKATGVSVSIEAIRKTVNGESHRDVHMGAGNRWS